eukprot:5496696-Alexandrium_andersonii.AAC.1
MGMRGFGPELTAHYVCPRRGAADPGCTRKQQETAVRQNDPHSSEELPERSGEGGGELRRGP